MSILTRQLSSELAELFSESGYDAEYAAVRVSDRPDLCEFQCNSAMAAAKKYRKAPYIIAEDIVRAASGKEDLPFLVEAVKPGFLNLNVKKSYHNAELHLKELY